MWQQKSDLKTIRAYGKAYLIMHKNFKMALKGGKLQTILDRIDELRRLNNKTKSETGLSAKTCAGFVIPAQYEGQCC